MYLRKAWDVLLVDDEPDVLSVTKLALKNVEIYGIPIKIHTAGSKNEAIDWLKTNDSTLSKVALALIDVIMETDHAGLELCSYMRSDMGNRTSPIYLRTGQPGKAPERRIIDELDISGYVSKVEATEDRLYTIVKSAVRQFLWARVSEGILKATNRLIEVAGSRAKILEGLQMPHWASRNESAARTKDTLESHSCLFIGDEFVGVGNYTERAQAEALRTELTARPRVETAFGGTVQTGGNKTMLQVDGPVKVQCLAEHSFDTLPDFYLRAWFGFLAAIRNVWMISK